MLHTQKERALDYDIIKATIGKNTWFMWMFGIDNCKSHISYAHDSIC